MYNEKLPSKEGVAGEQGAAVLRIEGLPSIRADLALESSSTQKWVW